MPRFDHVDPLVELGKNVGLGRKLAFIHESIRTQLPQISRIAAALYDAKTDTVKTFVHSCDGDEPLLHYQARLSDVPSLRRVLIQRRPRVIDDLGMFSGQSRHTNYLRTHGHRSSYTMPMFEQGLLYGFLFFNSRMCCAFNEEVLRLLDPYGHLIAQSIINEQKAVHNLTATVKSARYFHHMRDDETSAHQDRMSRYARLIAQKLPPHYALDDEFVEGIFVFSPLHDIGKLAIPDHILFKPATLTVEEFAVMKTHALKGRQFVDQLLANFSLTEMPHVQMLRNIAEFHHEAMDGSGYPHGLTRDQIPLEARIAAVADVFDALTSRRPYKGAWSNEEAYAALLDLRGSKLDEDCVDAFLQHRPQVEEIQQQFREED